MTRARARTLLLAASLAASGALRLGAQRPLGRRAAFSSFGGALLAPQVGRAAFSGALGGALLAPQAARALDPAKDRPNDSLLLILRVKEAAAQETRLIKSGKFRDLQRNSIKLAISLMLDNYQLLDNVNKCARLAGGSRSQEAFSVGQSAVEALQSVLEYFDSSSSSLKVDTISSEKQAFVVRALDVASQRLDQFLAYLPPEQVATAVAFIDYENELNLREYAQANPGQGTYLNPKPT